MSPLGHTEKTGLQIILIKWVGEVKGALYIGQRGMKGKQVYRFDHNTSREQLIDAQCTVNRV